MTELTPLMHEDGPASPAPPCAHSPGLDGRGTPPAAPAAPGSEAWRQQQLLQVLWRQAPEDSLAGWLRQSPAQAARGWSAYRANGLALAERALAAACPTVAALIGEAAMAGLARTLWRAHPPTAGDIHRWGRQLPQHLAQDAQLAELPYLADVARLDWAVADAEAAADATPLAAADLAVLASEEGAATALQLAPGLALLDSAWPVASLWCAHHPEATAANADAEAVHGLSAPATAPQVDDAALARAFAAVQAVRGEHALVWRRGWRGRVQAVSAGDAALTRALLQGQALGAALDAALLAGGEGWGFEPWLLQALQEGWIVGWRPVTPPDLT